MLCGKTHVAINYMHAPDYVLQRRCDVAGLSHDVCCESTAHACFALSCALVRNAFHVFFPAEQPEQAATPAHANLGAWT